MPIRLEDYLENPNLLTKKISLENTIDAIIDDGGITNTTLTEDEIEQLRFPSDDEYYKEDGRVQDWFESGTQILDQHIKNGNKDILEGESILPDYLINDPEIVGYPSLEMQEEIYQWILDKFWFNNVSIKDLGAGRGDFYGYLNKRVEQIQYFGIESRDTLVAAGKQKYPGINLLHENFLNQNIQTDYSVCIGTLNDKHEEDKWKHFNKILNHVLSNTKQAVIFVLSSNMDDLDNFYDYPLSELFQNLPSDLPCEIDYSKFQDIYVLVVYCQPFT